MDPPSPTLLDDVPPPPPGAPSSPPPPPPEEERDEEAWETLRARRRAKWKLQEAEATEAAQSMAPALKKFRTAPVPKLNVVKAVDKGFEGTSFRELADSPTSALQGLNDKSSTALGKLGVRTVRELGTWRLFKVAKAIVGLASFEVEGKRPKDATLNINLALEDKYHSRSLKEILALPPRALQGVTPEMETHLEKLQITSVVKLGEYKFAKWSEWVVELSEFEVEGSTVPGDARTAPRQPLEDE
uniref:Uncharacterized protein n=1 Tax=Noctiluca scintillans TaxID=2966 RepID=A0A7S1AK03_NOCSC